MNTTMQLNGMQPGPSNPMMMQPQGANGAMGRPVEQASDDPNVNLAEQKKRLNTAIYDYFLKMGEYDLARSLKGSQLVVKTDSNKRKADDDDLRDDPNRPSDLPPAGIPLYPLTSDTAFLLDWYSIFYDLFTRNDTSKASLTGQYLQHTQNMNRMQQQQQQNIMRQGMIPNNPGGMMMRNNNMMMPRNPGAMNPQQQQMIRQRMMQNMRDGPAMDGDGNRPRTPSSGENAPSPPKRQRIDGQPFTPGMMNGGGMPGQMDPNMMQHQRAQNLLLANGINPAGMTQQQMANFGAQSQQRANMTNQGSPNMMNPNLDMQQAMQSGGGDFYNGNNMNRAGVNGQNGHALQDYQMQLMLLERQNRKRLEMAKQEQEVGGVGANGNLGMNFPPNMSPQGSRQGPSPNPNDMKRGTPQIPKAGIPGSPMPDGGPRASPSAMNYGAMPGMENGMRPGPNGMQPPASHPAFQNGIPANMNPQQIAAMRGQAGGPMPGQPGFQPGQGPMGPGNQQPGPNGQMGTPRQANAAMPPPQGVPPSNGNATGRAPSPAPSAAASTPQTTKAANPKKETKKDRKQSTKNKKAAATPAENTEAPATSQPATPLTPALTNGAAFDNNKKNNANGNVSQPNGAPAPASQPGQPAALPNDMHDADMSMGPFNDSLNFGDIEAGDVLEQFNFDAFIDDGSGNLDNFSFDMGGFDGEMQASLEGQA